MGTRHKPHLAYTTTRSPWLGARARAEQAHGPSRATGPWHELAGHGLLPRLVV